MPYRLTRKNEFTPARWAGGTTTELFIHPHGASNAARNFDLRISTATVDLKESTFSDFSGYERHIAPLAGTMRLEHEGHHTVTLHPCETDSFSGSWTTRSFGACVDFNLIHRPGWTGTITGIAEPTVLRPRGKGYTGIYALREKVVATVSAAGKTAEETLFPGDFLLVESDGTALSCRLFCRTDEPGCFAAAASVFR